MIMNATAYDCKYIYQNTTFQKHSFMIFIFPERSYQATKAKFNLKNRFEQYHLALTL